MYEQKKGDSPLHLACVELMLPYFFDAGHVNNARDGLYYLKSMEAMPTEKYF